mgnify:CR=1 FL=1
MDQPFPWILVAFAAGLAGMLVVGAFVLVRLRADSVPLSPEDRAEWSRVPLTALQKWSWLGLLLGLVECGVLYAFFAAKGGAAVYWEDDAMRLQVVGIFLGVQILQAMTMALGSRSADERDQRVLRLAPQVQAVGLLLGLAGWNVFLGQKFHDEGAVPMVYTYLTFGSLLIVYMTCWFAGVLLGYRLGRIHAQG